MRLFLALDIDSEIRRRIAQFMDGVRGFAPDARWVPAESLHITLKFIGEWPAEQLDELKRALAGVGGQPAEITFSGTGFFPTPKSARVFWIGIQAGAELASLAKAVDVATSALGIESEQRAFAPHLTLARTGSGRPQRMSSNRGNASFRHLQEKLAAMPAPAFGTMSPREFFLYQSKLSSKGAEYTKLQSFPL
ncbi:MAG TPA: RNA 2',3'-cyclic phosphodiesterase [Terriglobales bacterium]|nr:RNA 2',3'-cyclic phosphodiesterase [Terriglobales bacterium]